MIVIFRWNNLRTQKCHRLKSFINNENRIYSYYIIQILFNAINATLEIASLDDNWPYIYYAMYFINVIPVIIFDISVFMHIMIDLKKMIDLFWKISCLIIKLKISLFYWILNNI